MKNFTLSLLFSVALTTLAVRSQAQCPTPTGMTGTAVTIGGNCFFIVQFAIPGSNVSIYNANGYVADASANAQGLAFVPYPCAASPITAIVSLTTGGASCTNFTISAGAPVPLPIKLTSFTAHLVQQGVLLKWETAFEIDNEKYVIEKSTDGSNFTRIGELAGSGSTLDKNNYSYADASLGANEVAYYRLKQIDIDGKFTYSKVVYVNTGATKGALRIAPNPFASDIQLIGISAADLNGNNIRLHNIAGAAVKFEISGSNSIRVDPAAPQGMYFLTVNGQAYKLMKN